MFGFVAGGQPYFSRVAAFIKDNYSDLVSGELGGSSQGGSGTPATLASLSQGVSYCDVDHSHGNSEHVNDWTASASFPSISGGVVSSVPSTIFFLNWHNTGITTITDFEVNGSSVTADSLISDSFGLSMYSLEDTNNVSNTTSAECYVSGYSGDRQPTQVMIWRMPSKWEVVESFTTEPSSDIEPGAMVIGMATDNTYNKSCSNLAKISTDSTFGGSLVFERGVEWYQRLQLAVFVNDTKLPQSFDYTTANNTNIDGSKFFVLKQVH